MSKLSGIRDLDIEILGKVDDVELLKVCSIDKYTWSIVCDDVFLKRRLLAKYPEIEGYKSEGLSWKHFFLKVVHYISLLKKEYNYDYKFGDCVIQYYLLKNYSGIKNILLYECAKIGELSLLIWSLKMGADIHVCDDCSLRDASKNGHFEIVKYLVEAGADIHAYNDHALILASENGHLETVKYLMEAGADIHAEDDYALICASRKGHLKTVKYLVEAGADIHAENGEALNSASRHRHLETVKYLVEEGADINDLILTQANFYGHLELVKYLNKVLEM